jgi:hypothetical protein
MQKNSEDFSMQEALRLAQSPAGQRLLAMLRQQNQGQMETAIDQAKAGNMEDARRTIEAMMNTPELQQLLRQLGR